jgi:hypothetical protein
VFCRLGEREEPVSDELLVAFDWIQMDVQRGVLGKSLERRTEGLEDMDVALVLLPELLESVQECLGGGLRPLTPDLQRQVQEGQIELKLLLVVSALGGEVRCRFSRAGECCGAVQHHIVLFLALPIALLASEALFFPSVLTLVACHGWRPLRFHRLCCGERAARALFLQ